MRSCLATGASGFIFAVAQASTVAVWPVVIAFRRSQAACFMVCGRQAEADAMGILGKEIANQTSRFVFSPLKGRKACWLAGCLGNLPTVMSLLHSARLSRGRWDWPWDAGTGLSDGHWWGRRPQAWRVRGREENDEAVWGYVGQKVGVVMGTAGESR